ncbi:MAG: replication-associated recombination protein A [Clostridia bacterium]|nr:replication-associated recombination protein A [Clostridia bacterium]
MYKLFETEDTNIVDSNAPLADRMRPQSLREFLGQTEVAGDGSLLRRAITMDRLGSCIFYGPPGTGKTTLANIIANSTSGNFVKLNAVTSGVQDVKKAVDLAKQDMLTYGKKTYLLLDECHRFNKTQQDSLLPSIESGTIVFIGSTTENPYASMTPAIISRCRVFEFKSLSDDTVKGALKKALTDKKRGLGNVNAEVSEDAISHIARVSAGDLRTAYNALELAVLTTPVSDDGVVRVTVKDAEQSIQKKSLSIDENTYYHLLSAFCKSLRGSDSDAAIYYSQRLIKAGCDPLVIARRLIVHSAEDIGLADPFAMVMATSALTAMQNIGLPEGLIPLTEAIIYVCEAHKSNSVIVALEEAGNDVEIVRDDDIPPYLINPAYRDEKGKKESAEYKYPHLYGEWVKQQYLPNKLKDKKYYRPTTHGYESEILKTRKEKGKE